MRGEGFLEGAGAEEAGVHMRAELLEVGEGHVVQFDAAFEGEADGAADVLMREPEGDALVDEVGGGSHGVEIAVGGGVRHAVGLEGERGGKGGEEREDAEEGFDGVEDGFLRLLEVLVVRERQALDEGGEGLGVAEQAGGLATEKLGEVGIFLLRHGGGAGGEALGQVDKGVLGGGEEDDLFGEAREVEAKGGGDLGEL